LLKKSKKICRARNHEHSRSLKIFCYKDFPVNSS
jgi:hypothetical protein